MKIDIHLTTGEICTFELMVEKPLEMLNKIRPTELFHRPLHQFLGRMQTVSVNPSCIEWIELETQETPNTLPFAKNTKIRQLSPEMFRDRVADNQIALKNVAVDEEPRNLLLAYAMATFKSGHGLYFEIQSKMERTEDRVKVSQKIFNMPALFINGASDGLFLVNTSNIVLWRVVPGLKKSTFFAVPAELVGLQKGN